MKLRVKTVVKGLCNAALHRALCIKAKAENYHHAGVETRPIE